MGHVARPVKRGIIDKPVKAALLRQVDPIRGNPHLLDQMAKTAITKAIKGDMQAMTYVSDRLDGRVPYQQLGVAESAAPIKIIITGVPRPGRDIVDVTPTNIIEPPKTITDDSTSG